MGLHRVALDVLGGVSVSLLLVACGARNSLPSEQEPATGATSGSTSSSATGSGGSTPVECTVGEVTPIVLATQQRVPRLAIDATHFWWAEVAEDANRVWRASRSAGNVELMGQANARQIAVDETHLFRIHANFVGREPKDGGTEESVGPYGGNGGQIIFDGERVFMAAGELFNKAFNGSLVSANRDGSDRVVLATALPYVVGLAVSADHVYWTDWVQGGGGWQELWSLKRVARAGGPTTVLLDGAQLGDVVVHAGKLFYTQRHMVDGFRIFRADLDASNAEVVSSTKNLSRHLVAARGCLFTTSHDGVYALSPDGGTPWLIAEFAGAGIVEFSVDHDALIFADFTQVLAAEL